MAGRKYTNQTGVRVVDRKTGKVNRKMSKRLRENNALSRVVEQNERLGAFENSPLNLIGKGVNRAAELFSSKRNARVIRQTRKATKILKKRGKATVGLFR